MQFPILQYLDVVIGLAVVMIVVATFVTAVTQFIMSATYARARYLRDGLQGLIAQLDPSKLGDHARYLAELALREETVGGRKILPWLTAIRNGLCRYLPRLAAVRKRQNLKWNRLPSFSPATVVQREELILLLLQLVSQAPAGNNSDARGAALGQLLSVVKGDSTFNVDEILKEIQKEILNQETEHPRAPTTKWRSAGIQAVVKRTEHLHDFVAKLNSWFDNTMDRVTANFTFEARVVTAVVAFLVCAWLQLDTVALVKRLSTDPSYRNAIVSQAKDMGVLAQDPQSNPAQTTSLPEPDKAKEQLVAKLAEVRNLSLIPANPGFRYESKVFNALGLVQIEVPWFKAVEPGEWPWPGLLLSWVLVSLGAPFWYDVLKNVMGLRSSLARADDKDRQDRRAQQLQ